MEGALEIILLLKHGSSDGDNHTLKVTHPNLPGKNIPFNIPFSRAGNQARTLKEFREKRELEF